MIRIFPVNASVVKIVNDDYGIDQEISEFFTFVVPGFRFMPAYKSGRWDGKVRMFDMRKKTLPRGLLDILLKFIKDNKYECECDVSLRNRTDIKLEDACEFMQSLDLHARGVPLEARDYQYLAVGKSLETKRNILISPTSSGKSAIIYTKVRYHLDKLDHRVLLVVPSTQLVEQMFSDFKDYSSANGWDVDQHCQVLYSGKDKVFSKSVMISTWQSLHAMKKNSPRLFQDIVDNTDVAVFDEAHTYKADAVIDTMNSFVNTEWRTGTTGTLDDSKMNQLTLIGLMGMPYQVITTKELMDAGQIATLKIKAIVLQHPPEICKAMKGMDYKTEIQYLISSDARNQFISKLALACTGNTLILFNFVDKHGKILYDIISKLAAPGRTVKLISGGVAVRDREEIRRLVDTEKDAIMIATSSLFSTGTNIPSIENIIFGVPTKSTIRVRQSIGRGLRLKHGKDYCTLFDISDDLSHKSYKNTTLSHLEKRIEIYDKEQFEYSLIRSKL